MQRANRKIFLNKKGSQEESSSAIIGILILILVLLIVISLAIRFAPKLTDFLKNIPGFNNTSNAATTTVDTNPSNQPVELRKDNPCIGYNFYWSNSSGGVLQKKLTNSMLDNNQIYVAISFNEDVGNLNMDKAPDNPKSFCGYYQVVVQDENDKTTKSESFANIQQDYSKNTIKKTDKTYFLVPFEITGANHVYSFTILNDTQKIIRVGPYKITGPTRTDNALTGVKSVWKKIFG